MKSEQVQAMIDSAFAPFQQPCCKEDLSAGGIDGPYVVDHYFIRTREQIAARASQGGCYVEDFSYMQPAAVGYYLPALMYYMMAHPDDSETWHYLGSYLSIRENGKIWWNLQHLGRDACQAIALWAKWLEERFVELEVTLVDIHTAEAIARHYRNAEPDASPNGGPAASA